jgi:hypothetical protein
VETTYRQLDYNDRRQYETHENDPFFVEKRRRGDELIANYRGGIPDWDRAIEHAKAKNGDSD